MYLQVSFERGMIETTKQDQDSELGQPFSSVLWLQNFNPNIVFGGAVKRSGYGAADTPPVPLFFTNPGEVVESVVYSVTAMPVRSPKASDAVVVFYDYGLTEYGFEPNKIYAKVYGHSYIGDDLIENWNDVYGYQVEGVLGDYTRYGQNILFTSLPNEYFSRMSAVYKLFFWDGTKYWAEGQRLLNGVIYEDYATPKQAWAQWRIAEPSSSITQKTIGIYRIEDRLEPGDSPLVAKNLETGDSKYVSQHPDYIDNLITDDIALIVWEQPNHIVDVNAFLNNEGGWTNGSPNTYSLYINPYFENTPIATDGRFTNINSLEYLNADVPLTLWQGAIYSNFTYTSIGYRDPRGDTTSPPYFATSWEEDKNAFIPRFTNPYNACYMFATQDYPISFVMNGWYRARRNIRDKTTGNNYVKNLIVPTEIITGRDQGGEAWVDDPNIYAYTNLCQVSLQDYLNLKIPRAFLGGEEIPLLIVGKINGINVLLKSFTYKVKGNARELNETRRYLPEGNGAEFHFATSPNDVGDVTFLDGNPHVIGRKDNLAGMWECEPINTGLYQQFPENRRQVISNIYWVPQSSLISGKLTTPNAWPPDYYADMYLSSIGVDYRRDNPTTEQGAGRNIVKMSNIHKSGNNVYMSISIKIDEVRNMMAAGLTSISVYIGSPSTTDYLLYSRGITFSEMDGVQYALPKKLVDNNYSDFALFKEFQLQGEFNYLETYDRYEGAPLTTNCWGRFGGERYIAVPMQANDMDEPGTPFNSGGETCAETPHFILDSFQRQNRNFLPKSNPGYSFDDLRVNETLAYNNIQFKKDETNEYRRFQTDTSTIKLTKTNVWSPDFCVWDYPTSQPLILDSSGRYWEGMGARCICVIKGRVFIGGVINKTGEEEQAIIRYSDVQGGVISQDIFSLENKLIVGHNPHSALAEYREQLWAFSQQDVYRLQMPSITDPTTWEFLDVIQQGTFSPKTVVTTPYGVVFANSGGVWISDGGMPENLALPILGSYQSMANGKYYNYMFDTEGFEYPVEEWNKFMEVIYDKFKDEVVIMSTATERGKEIGNEEDTQYINKLVFSFPFRNWRIEKNEIPLLENSEEPENNLVLPVVSSTYHRMSYSSPELHHSYLYINNVHFLQEIKNYTKDAWVDNNVNVEIDGKIIFHEQGNGKDDYLLQRVIAEIAPTSEGLASEYLPGSDPKMVVSLRNSIYTNDSVLSNENNAYTNFDLIQNNMRAKGGPNPFVSAMQTPNEPNNYAQDKVLASTEQRWESGNETIGYTGRESLIMLAPLNSKFRRMRMVFQSKITAVIRSVTLYLIEKKRRGYG